MSVRGPHRMERAVDAEENDCWSRLPDVVLSAILYYLRWPDRVRAALACRAWHRQLSAPALWRQFTFTFVRPTDRAQLQLIASHGAFMRDLSITFDPHSDARVNDALELLVALGRACTAGTAHPQRLAVGFAAPPPTGRRWAVFATALSDLFLTGLGDSLEVVDLSAYSVAPDDSLARALAAGCGRRLRTLDLLSGCSVTLLKPTGLLSLLQSCPMLERLAVRQASLSDDCLDELLRPSRTNLKLLSLAYGSQERYCADLSLQRWSLLAERHRGSLSVSLSFDYTCPSDKPLAAMAPDAPVTSLCLLTRNSAVTELQHAAEAYGRSLRSLTVDVEPGSDLERMLLHMCDICIELQTLHVINHINPNTQLALVELLGRGRRMVDIRFGLPRSEVPW